MTRLSKNTSYTSYTMLSGKHNYYRLLFGFTNYNSKLILILIIIILMMLHVSCSEKIELELDTIEQLVAIDARITDRPFGNRVILTQSTGYMADQSSAPVEGATVRLLSGKSVYYMKETSRGLYVMPDDFRGEAANFYSIEVDTGNEIYNAISEMREAVEIDSMLVRPHPWLSNHHELVVHFQDTPGRVNYYMWKVYKNGELLTDSLHKIPFTDSEVFSGRYVRAPIYIFHPEDGILQPGDVIRLDQYHITEEYYHFLIAMLRNSGTTGGPFTGPPSNVPSNYDNRALGFFMTASVLSYELIVD